MEVKTTNLVISINACIMSKLKVMKIIMSIRRFVWKKSCHREREERREGGDTKI